MSEIVIDANVLGCAAGEDLSSYSNTNADALFLLQSIRRDLSVLIAVDFEHLILGEYERRAHEYPVIDHWIRELQRQGRIIHYSHQLQKTISGKLRQMGFHRKDYKYVGVCLNTGDPKVIVNEIDSDWNSTVCDYLNSLNVSVVNTNTCISIYLPSAEAAATTDE